MGVSKQGKKAAVPAEEKVQEGSMRKKRKNGKRKGTYARPRPRGQAVWEPMETRLPGTESAQPGMCWPATWPGTALLHRVGHHSAVNMQLRKTVVT